VSISTRPGWLVFGQRDTLTEDLVTRLHCRYPSERYALLEQVRDGPGFSATSSGDLIAVGLWPSRGCEVEGFEIKASRADWLRELAAPAKAENLYAFCDRWWLVVPSVNDVLREGELPPTWGCIEARGKEKLRASVAAPKLTPQPIDRFFLAAILKRATAEPVRRSRLADAYAAGKRDGAAGVRSSSGDLETLTSHVKNFERAQERARHEAAYVQQWTQRTIESLKAMEAALAVPSEEEEHG